MTVHDWQKMALALNIEGRAFIDGEYRDALNGEVFDCLSPVDGRLLCQVASCDDADAELAVSAARQAFERGEWSRMAPAERKKVLLRLAQLMEAHTEELALLETLDMGKPISDSLSLDVPGSYECVAWTAEAIDKVYGEVAPVPENQLGLITREAAGVVAAIVPWNFPLQMACWKIAPALALGNSVILKPSEKSPLTAIRIAALAKEAGIPSGVFNVVPGFGHTIGNALAIHNDVDVLAFTGSTTIAKKLLEASGKSNMKRVWLEAGGKSPHLVFADADLDRAAEAVAAGIAFNQGEVCTAGSRLLVDESIKEALLDKISSAMTAWQPGDPLDPSTRVGAIVDRQQMEKILEYVEIGKQEGAKLREGGCQVLSESGGTYVSPAIFEAANGDMRVAREEIFGPVLSVISFNDEAQAVSIANDSEYGLAAGIWTRDLARAHRVSRALRAGSVWVNQYDAGDMTAPFGGYKQSGNGRDRSLHAFDKYSELKATWISLD
ncbi:aldehyde dehydrogenase [Pseudomonas kurunegalensis]|uniref:Aldehyde dehydrogenase n=1 Tax=Pseudomonas kurunegalensis TaxID=485880 RepID=A0ACC5UQH8_9PSED|nr:aldehyde dehydrogenase [Pseudomonas kurunegalensis]MBV4516611.1 aldehyde dehydrogenase [Pseudomonas kurunegalensis]